jgi:two-component system sensor histidine kinase VicK
MTLIFVALVVAVELLVGAFSIIGTINYYHKDFSSVINTVFNDDLKTELRDAANALTFPEPVDNNGILIEEMTEENINQINDIIRYYLGPLAISSSRFYTITDGSGENILYSSNNANTIEMTPVLKAAAVGTESLENGFMSSYLDYALPLGNESTVKYIVYIKDTCDSQVAAVKRTSTLYAYALLISAILALILGNILSATITVPMRNLTVQAKKLADGDMNALEPSNAHDEFGNLTNSLVYLAHTRQESTDRALSEKTKVETILQNMTDGILAFDLHGKLIHFNPEAQRLLDRKYLDDIQFDRFFKEINANITLGDLLYMKPDGLLEREIKLKNQYLRLNFATFSVDNKIGGIIVVIHDVTRQEKLEQSRRDFVANVSHELRTPLTTIKSYSETLSDMPDVDRELQVRFLDVIASEADRMARIISDLLTLSELDENQTYYKTPEEINIRKMLENIVERMGMTAKKKNQTLTYHPINETPIISGDRDSLERVIINIVSNALKYTGEGGNIEVYSSKVYKDICIKVSDNGIGIQKDKLPHIFDRFYRVDKARSRDTGGTGLGLAIAKQSIESAFNGKIKISSEFNKGTEVTITIPVNN